MTIKKNIMEKNEGYTLIEIIHDNNENDAVYSVIENSTGMEQCLNAAGYPESTPSYSSAMALFRTLIAE